MNNLFSDDDDFDAYTHRYPRLAPPVAPVAHGLDAPVVLLCSLCAAPVPLGRGRGGSRPSSHSKKRKPIDRKMTVPRVSEKMTAVNLFLTLWDTKFLRINDFML